MIFKIILFLLFIFTFSIAQVVENNGEIIQTGDENSSAITQVGSTNIADIQQYSLDAINRAIIEQYGSNNEAFITQNQDGIGTDPNFAKIWQNGNNNNASIDQTGYGNDKTIEQNGNNNTASQSIIGNENIAAIIQNGDGNIAKQELNGNELNYVIEQQGYGNSFTQIETGQQGKAYTVNQRGNNMNLIIVNGRLPFYLGN